MSGSSSTIRRLGWESSGMGFDAFQEGALRLVEGGDVQVERGEHRADAYLFVSAFEQPQHHRYELATGEKIGSDEPLGQKREPGARLRTAMRDAVDFDRARVEFAKVEQALDQCGLAGAVYTGQAQAFARGDIEIDPAQHFGAAKALAHSEESNQRLGHKAALRGEASMIAQRRRPFTVDLRMPRTGDGLRSELSPRTFLVLEFALCVFRAGHRGDKQSRRGRQRHVQLRRAPG